MANMTTRARGWIVLLLLAVPGLALAGAGVSAHCDGTEIAVTVTVFNEGEFPAEWTGFVVQRSLLGACDTETIITPEPLPIPEQLFTEVFHSLTDTYENEGVFQVYKVWATNAAGDLLPVWGLGVPGTMDFAACGEALATRGTLTVASYEYFEMEITECPDTCWFACSGQGLVGLTPEMFEALMPYVVSQTPVDLFGVLQYEGMPVAYCIHEVTSFAPTPGGLCGPVPAQRRSWDGVKAYYR